ncbi:SOUL family heme-binding protein [Halosimplex sp. TS25]|uniref:SOUL family heme-binding protein n=1 Tax=Halosimplex rarum TaxID=3396619 RepID=UPI0039ED091B
MVRKSAVIAGAVGGIAAAVGGWTLYQRRTTETVPYTVVARLGDVELRRYPELVLAETVAPSENEAFGRLFRYISGENDGGDDLEMTAPVEVTDPGTKLAMTAPVEVARPTPARSTTAVEPGAGRAESGVRMAFYLPPEYDLDSAPSPSDDVVDLVSVPERTLAVRRFSWRPTDDRVDRETDRLLETLDEAGVPLDGEPFFMGYDAPWTLPPLRRNEVAVQIESSDRS